MPATTMITIPPTNYYNTTSSFTATTVFPQLQQHSPPFATSAPVGLFDSHEFGQDVEFQFKKIQLNLSNGSSLATNQLDIHSLRAYCQRNDVSLFAKSLAEYIAGMQHPSSSFCDGTTRFLLIIFLCVGFIGFIGNLLTVLVILRTPSLHSQTNYFLASLAFSDLFLILVGVPFDIFFLWRRKSIIPPFNGFCETTSTFISWFTFNSILTIVSLTGERLVAICYPFSLRPWFHRNAIWLIFILWVLSFFPSLYIGLQFKMVIQDFCGRTHKHPNGIGSKCDFVGWGGSPSNEDYTFEVMLFLTFIIPVFFIVYCYVKILRTLNKATCNSHQLNATQGIYGQQLISQYQILAPTGAQDTNSPLPHTEDNGERVAFFNNNSIRFSSRREGSFGQQFRDSFIRNSQRSQQAHKTVMKMLIMIAALFFICYLPYHLERLIVKYHDSQGCAEPQACLWLYHGSGLLQYISAALNPIIYNVMSRRFRREFQRICYRIVRKEPKPEMRCRCLTGPNQHLQMTPLNRLL